MIVLGIETSTTVCSVGLAQDTKLVGEERVLEKRIHSEKLLSLVIDLLSRQGISRNEIDAIAVSIGPGSFTGLRIGLSTAKGLCHALDIPLLAVPTFESIAHAASMVHSDAENILVALDAKKGDFYVGRFRKRGESIESRGMTNLLSGAEVQGEIVVPALVVTDREDIFRMPLHNGAMVKDVHEFCRGDIVAQLGVLKARAKKFEDPASCEPAYLKDFVVIGKSSAV